MEFNNKFPIDGWSKEENIAVPDEDLQKTGFEAEYQPPAHFFNWFWNLVIKGINELQSKLSTAYTELLTLINNGSNRLTQVESEYNAKIATLEAKDEQLKTDVNNVIPTISETKLAQTSEVGLYKVTRYIGSYYWAFVVPYPFSDELFPDDEPDYERFYQVRIAQDGRIQSREGHSGKRPDPETEELIPYVWVGSWETTNGMQLISYTGDGSGNNNWLANLGYCPTKIEFVRNADSYCNIVSALRGAKYISRLATSTNIQSADLQWTNNGVTITATRSGDNNAVVALNEDGVEYVCAIYR